MLRFRLRTEVLAAAIVALSGVSAYGQWVDQTIQFVDGYNAVFLEVTPAEAVADNFFGAIEAQLQLSDPSATVDQVYVYRPSLAGVGIACPDPNDPECEPQSNNDDYRFWFPPPSTLSSLFTIRAGQVYVMEVSLAGPAPATITGQPDTSKTRWLEGFNLVGFHVDPSAPPSFDTYLGANSAFDNKQVYEIDTAGELAQVADTSVAITPGRGYWVSSSTNTVYDGPLDIDAITLRGLDFGRQITEYQIQFDNRASAARTVTLIVTDSVTPPAPPTDAGVLGLQFRDYDSGQLFSLTALQAPDNAFSVQGAGTQDSARLLRLSIDRSALTATAADAAYQSILEINDGAGYRRFVGVRAEVTDRAGLYLGTVAIDHVAWVQANANIVSDPDEANGYENPTIVSNPDSGSTTTPRPTVDPFIFPIILHFDGDSTYTFLDEATLLFKPAADPDPAEFVIATPDCGAACDGLLNGSIVDGEPFRLRYTTTAFTLSSDEVLSGSFQTSLSAENVVVSKDSPLNPFRHAFHPDHDGDVDGETWDITRSLHMSFAGCDPLPSAPFDFTCATLEAQVTPPGLNDVFLNGCYREVITGLHKNPINLCGKLELRRVSSVSTLNDQ